MPIRVLGNRDAKPRSPDGNFVAIEYFSLAGDSHERAGARSQVRKNDRTRLLFDGGVGFTYEGIVRERHVALLTPNL